MEIKQQMHFNAFYSRALDDGPIKYICLIKESGDLWQCDVFDVNLQMICFVREPP